MILAKRLLIISFAVLVLIAGCFGAKDKGDDSGKSDDRKGVSRIIPGFMRRDKDDDKDGIYQEYDFVVEVAGRLRTRGHRTRRPTTYRGLRCVESKSQQETTIVRNGVEFSRNVQRQVITGPHAEALYSKEVTYEGNDRTELRVTVDKGVAVFEETGESGKTRREEVSVTPGVLFALDELWISQQPLAVGKTFEADVLSQRLRKVVRETATVQQIKNIIFDGENTDAYVIKTESEATPNNPVFITITEGGHLVRMEATGAVFRVVGEDDDVVADEPGEIDTIITSVPMNFDLPAIDSYDSVSLTATPADEWAKHVESSEYCTVNDDGTSFNITVNRFMPRVRSQEPFPIPNIPPELVNFTRSVGNIIPDNPTIRKQARSIVRDEKDALRAVAYLAGWVHSRIKWNAKGRMNTSPVDTLRRMRGDCSEHADLFASMARAVGIPTRHCLGLKLENDKAVYHNWVEAFVGSTWVPVDTTVNRVGLPPAYILTARDIHGTEELVDTLPWAMRQNKLGLSVENILTSGKTLIPEQKRTYINTDGSWLANLYYGFGLSKPNGWNGRITMKSVELTSPDGNPETADSAGGFIYGSATFKVECMEAEYRGSEVELSNLVRTLKSRVPDFKENESSIVTFAKSRSLYIDFSFTSDGKRVRYRQYIVPRIGRSYRIGLWAPEEKFSSYVEVFDNILKSVKL